MPVWLIDIVGARELDRTFLVIALMTLPVWVAMLVFPNTKLTRRVAQPLVAPVFYCLVLFVLVWRAFQASMVPESLDGISYSAARQLARHPAAFLAIFCNFQIINLAVGTMIYQKACRSGIRAPVELVLCCLLGAPALIPFAIRLFLKDKPLS